MKKTTNQPLTKLADAAFEQAAQKVIARAEQSGTPVIVWEDEAVANRKAKGGRLEESETKKKEGS